MFVILDSPRHVKRGFAQRSSPSRRAKLGSSKDPRIRPPIRRASQG